MGFEIDI